MAKINKKTIGELQNGEAGYREGTSDNFYSGGNVGERKPLKNIKSQEEYVSSQIQKRKMIDDIMKKFK